LALVRDHRKIGARLLGFAKTLNPTYEEGSIVKAGAVGWVERLRETQHAQVL